MADDHSSGNRLLNDERDFNILIFKQKEFQGDLPSSKNKQWIQGILIAGIPDSWSATLTTCKQ